MQLYISKAYYSKQNKKQDNMNVFLVLNEEERDRIKKKYIQLISHIINNGFPLNWNSYDDEMIEFIPKMFNYHSKRKDCMMLDPTLTQTKKLDRMLKKIPGIDGNFIDWAELDAEEKFSEPSKMKKIMDKKRKLKSDFDKKEVLIESRKSFTEDIISF